ncbi:hypothetical protein [Celeribacter naphthalenivorans]|uniref:hypothetical protein n=1 Tax=Celeribacter naphthalenivorans TaxID=1614694 RepID=UPI001CF9D979|nr:hypothetical protein [Celeribacter naphthalenivorans]
MISIDSTASDTAIEIEALKRTAENMLELVPGDAITVSGPAADCLRDSLRGTVIEADLQGLCHRGGVNLLTGIAERQVATEALSCLPHDQLEIVKGWRSDAIAVHFVDARAVRPTLP